MDNDLEINALKNRITDLENDVESLFDYFQTVHETLVQIFGDIEQLNSNHEGLVANWGFFVMPEIRRLQEKKNTNKFKYK